MKVKIEGVSELLRTFDGAPNDLMNAVRKAIRKTVNEESRNIKKSIPNARDLVKAKAKTTKKGNVIGRVGLFADNSSDRDMHWYHQYWKNYGTLQRRDPSHTFDNPIKHDSTTAAKRRRNRMGQFYERFFENAIEGFDQRSLKSFVRYLKEQGYDIE